MPHGKCSHWLDNLFLVHRRAENPVQAKISSCVAMNVVLVALQQYIDYTWYLLLIKYNVVLTVNKHKAGVE